MVSGRSGSFQTFSMEKESKREQKRNSAKKSRERQVYTQKHIRIRDGNKTRLPSRSTVLRDASDGEQ